MQKKLDFNCFIQNIVTLFFESDTSSYQLGGGVGELLLSEFHIFMIIHLYT